MKPILIWGAGGHARVVADIIELGGEYEIAAFLDDSAPRARNTFLQRPLFDSRDALTRLHARGVQHIVIAIGHCDVRLQLGEIARSNSFALARAVHPQAIVARDVQMGAGSVVMAGAIINPNCTIGESVIINTGARLDHDCIIEDGAHVSPGVTLAGGVIVERAAWIGVGATVSDQRRIGSRAIIGAGAVVVRDIPDNVTAYGVPARIQSNRNEKL